MPTNKPQLDINEILRQMGYGGLFADPFAGDYTRDPKNYYATAWDAYDKMLAWDAEINALDKLARVAVLSHDSEIVPWAEGAEHKKAAGFCIEMVSNIKNWEDICYDLLEPPAKGLAVIQKNIVRDGRYYTVADNENGPALQTLPQSWFYWKMVDGRSRLVFRGTYGGSKEVPIDEELFIIARHAYTLENPYGRGYLTDAFWTFVLKKILRGCMAQLVQRGVEPERWAQCTADDVGKAAWDMQDKIVTALSELNRHSEGVFPPGTELNHQQGDSAALRSEIDFTYLLDNYSAKLVLGQTLTTDQGRTGSYELGKIHDLQQARFTISRCKKKDAYINDQLLTPLCELNFNVGRAKYKTKYEPEDDRTDQAKRIVMLANKYDLELKKGYVHHAQGFPAPENPDELYVPVRSGGGGGFGAFAAGQKKNPIITLASGDSRRVEADKRVRLIDSQVTRHLTLVKGTVDKRFKKWQELIDKSKSYDALVARIEARKREWPELADALRKAAVASYALGMAMQARETSVKAVAAPAYDTWEDVLRAFKDKVPISAEIFYALDQELRSKFFSTALAEDEHMATVLHDLTTKAMDGGETFATFKAGAYESMRSAGYTFPEPYRLETVFRRHISTADAAARDDWYSIPEINERIWGYEYLTSGRPNVRPEHAKLNHTKLPKKHMFWATNSPPNDYGCNCIKVPIPATGRNLETRPPDDWASVPNVEDGFAMTPGEMLRGTPT